jgi:hypothetical protein
MAVAKASNGWPSIQIETDTFQNESTLLRPGASDFISDLPQGRPESPLKDGRPAHHRPQGVPACRVDHAFARREINQEHRECRFVHLHTVPVRPAVEPTVLRPVAIRLLRHLQIAQHAPDMLMRADCDEAARDLDVIPRPDQVIAAEIVIRLRERYLTRSIAVIVGWNVQM